MPIKPENPANVAMARIKKLLARLTCWRKRHWMCIAQMGNRDGDGKLQWPCQRCGTVQVLAYGLAARGHITMQSLAENERRLT